ncbi:MAG: hypothetical protein K6T29_07795, partial [Peptococcaceae bacterium]|nr:hypothetical protein [Peptococcaceae bacterium]
LKELDELPEPEGSKIGDIVELTPRTVEEFDRLQASGASGALAVRRLPGLARGAARAREILAARLAARKGAGKKG